MLNPKVKIAVRMPDKTRRLYVVDDVGMPLDEMRSHVLAEVPTATAILIGLPVPAPFLDEPLTAA